MIVFVQKVIIVKLWYMPYVSSGGADPFFLPPSRKSCTTLFTSSSFTLSNLAPTCQDEPHFHKTQNWLDLNLAVSQSIFTSAAVFKMIITLGDHKESNSITKEETSWRKTVMI
jgi:hypothetical protein